MTPEWSTVSRASYSPIRSATVCVSSCAGSRYMDSPTRSSAIGKYRSWHLSCFAERYSVYAFRVTKWPCFMGWYEFRPYGNSADWISSKASTTIIRWGCQSSKKMRSYDDYQCHSQPSGRPINCLNPNRLRHALMGFDAVPASPSREGIFTSQPSR